MLTWETLLKRFKRDDLDAKLIWQLLAVAITHPSYKHLVSEDIFNLIRQRTLDFG